MSVRVVLCTLACIQIHFAVRDDVDSLDLAAVADKHLAEQSFEESKSGKTLAEATEKLKQKDAMQQTEKSVSVVQKQDTKPLQARGGLEPLTTGMLIGIMVAIEAADSACGKANQGIKTAEALAACGQSLFSMECFRKLMIISNCGDLADTCYTGFKTYGEDLEKEIEYTNTRAAALSGDGDKKYVGNNRDVCEYESKKQALVQQHDASEANVTAATSEVTLAGMAAVFLAAEMACGLMDKRVKVGKAWNICWDVGFTFECAKAIAHVSACGETAFRLTVPIYNALKEEAMDIKEIYDKQGAGPAFLEAYKKFINYYEDKTKNVNCWNGKVDGQFATYEVYADYCIAPFADALAQAYR